MTGREALARAAPDRRVPGRRGAAIPLLYVAAQHLAAALYGTLPDTPALAGVLRKALANQLAFGTDQFVLGPAARFVVDNWTWAAAVAAPVAVLVAVGMWLASPTGRRAMLAFLALSLATYGIIAAGRAPVYPQFEHLLVRSDRYHYAAPLALAVVICVALAQVRARGLTPPLRTAALALWVAALAVALATVRSPVRNYEYAPPHRRRPGEHGRDHPRGAADPPRRRHRVRSAVPVAATRWAVK